MDTNRGEGRKRLRRARFYTGRGGKKGRGVLPVQIEGK